jgi:hypothetical protein
LRTPRAVDSMIVQLKKVSLSEADLQQLEHFLEKTRVNLV